MKKLILSLALILGFQLVVPFLNQQLKAEGWSEPIRLNLPAFLLGDTHYILQEAKLVQTNSHIKEQIKIAKAQVSVYPNPATEFIKITTDDFNQYQLFDEKGTIYRKGWIDESETILRNNIPAGIYFLKLTNTMGEVYYHRLVFN